MRSRRSGRCVLGQLSRGAWVYVADCVSVDGVSVCDFAGFVVFVGAFVAAFVGCGGVFGGVEFVFVGDCEGVWVVAFGVLFYVGCDDFAGCLFPESLGDGFSELPDDEDLECHSHGEEDEEEQGSADLASDR